MALFSLESKPIQQKGSSSYKYIAAVKANSSGNAVATFRGKNVEAKPITDSTSTNSTLINVCDSFDWSTTPYQNSNFNKKLIPRGEIKEYRMADDSVIQTLLYYADLISNAGDDVINSTIESGVNLVQAVTTAGTSRAASTIFSPGTSNAVGQAAGQQAGGAVSDVGAVAKEALAGAKNLLTKVRDVAVGGISPKTNTKAQDLKTDWMVPYNGLYSIEPTDFKYILPYLDAKFSDNDANWTDISMKAFGLDAIGTVAAAADNVSNLLKLVAPGQYVERPLIYDPNAATKPSVTFKFPLLNTQTFESVVNNYQFLLLLIYQNMPYRVNKSLMELPKLYEVLVPGVEYMRYSYVSNLNINFIGNRRHVDMPMPSGAGLGLPPTIKAIVPDAYDVTITFRSLTMRSSNMMLQMWKNSNFTI